ncbi:MAG: type IV pilus assembly protein PilM [Candidatus Nealsonbacteria bacterium]
MLEFLNLKQTAFGLDISDLSLKIVNLKKDKKHLKLTSFGETSIRPGIIEKGEIKNEKALAEIIKKAIKEVKGEKIKTKHVIASLPEEKAFLQVIPMPIMKEEELRKAIRFEAENYVPLPIEKVYLDFQIVPSVNSNQDHLDVLIAALPKKTIDPYVSSLEIAGLKPLVLEIESQAISLALIKNKLVSESSIIIDLGATRTSFIIFSENSLRFTSSIPVSSNKFTEAISKNMKVNLKKAENLKIKQGIKDKSKIFEVLTPVLADLMEQIKKYISYYHSHASQNSERKIDKIILCGGGANLPGLTDFLSFKLKLPVELGNPWTNILPKPLKRVPELSYSDSLGYTTALGLALRGLNL